MYLLGVSDSEVIDTPVEGQTESSNDESTSKLVEPEESSGACSEVTEQEEETEIQSQRDNKKGNFGFITLFF